MAGGLDEVDASVNTVIDQLCSVHPVLLLEVRVEPGLDVVNDRLPAARQLS